MNDKEPNVLLEGHKSDESRREALKRFGKYSAAVPVTAVLLSSGGAEAWSGSRGGGGGGRGGGGRGGGAGRGGGGGGRGVGGGGRGGGGGGR